LIGKIRKALFKKFTKKAKEVNINSKENNWILVKRYKKRNCKDGRYYKFEKTKGEFITLDLEYDFLKKNNIIQRFRNITDYD
jgi:hypothetical protein